MSPPLKLAMVGGGQGAFIGAVHRHAAALDGRWSLSAGALSSDPARAAESARALGLPPDRSYPSWRAMLAAESARPAADRADAVAIVTPNDTHFEIASAFASAGFNFIIDKPMVHSSDQARSLAETVRASGVLAAVTYNYTGYPMVRHAAHLVRTGALGTLRKVFVEYHQGWLATDLESTGHKQASWRCDPARAGLGGAVGDIGSHAENLLTTVTGLQIHSLCADLTSFVPGRALDDDASILIRFRGGARAVLTVSQVCHGENNNLSLRVYGESGSLRWRQEDPDRLIVSDSQGRTSILSRGTALGPVAGAATRLPPGHPEGFIEAFATIYRDFALALVARRNASAPPPEVSFPTIEDGARGVAFIEHAVRSSQHGAAWIDFAY